MSNSIFTKIINGQLPCYKLYEDELTFSFITLDQIQLGHSLIVPKKQIDYFIDVPEPYYSAVFHTAKTVSRAIHQATGCLRVGAIIAGLEVPHFHLHLVPLQSEQDIDFKKAKKRPEAETKEIHKKIISFLDSK